MLGRFWSSRRLIGRIGICRADKGGLRYQLFDASDEMYIARIDANQICFYCRVWPENFDFIPGEEGDEVMFINPEELLLQKGKIDAPARAYRVHMKWQELYSKQ